MKKQILFLAAVVCSLFVQAQDYDLIKNYLALLQYKPAKEKLDIIMQNPQFNTKPETYIVKAAVYAGMATQADLKGTATAEELIKEADIAFTKFSNMDPGLGLLTDPVYQNGPINIYSALYSSGYKDYQNKNWVQGLQKFKKVVDYADLLISKKILTMPIDTNALILAGIIAENAGSGNDAAKYYGRLADAKVGGDGFETIYRYLVTHYFSKKDFASFERYKALGKAVFPQSGYFLFDRIDFTIGLETDFNKKITALEELLAADPNNEKANQVLGEIIYDTLNPRKGSVAPANADMLEKKMIAAFNKAAAANPAGQMPWVYIGNYFVHQALVINEAIANAVKKEELTGQYHTTLEKAREPYEKAAAIYAKKTMLTANDKQLYKNIANSLAEIYLNKKDAAATKKWSDLYTSLR